jgi:hypothetical protein
MLTRRIMIRHSILAAAVAATAILSTERAHAAPPIPKRLADYQDQPNAGHECAACCMFVPGNPAHCTMIKGAIASDGWCKYWKAGPADTCS